MKCISSFAFFVFFYSLLLSNDLVAAKNLKCEQTAYRSFHNQITAKAQFKIDWLEQMFPDTIVENPVTIIYVDNINEWRKIFVESPISDWGAGVTIPGKNKIYILVSHNSMEKISEILVHEYVHVLLHRVFNPRPVPRWYEEGVAQYLSGRYPRLQDMVVLSNAVLAKRIPVLSSIDSVNYFFGNKAQIAYLVSLEAVMFLNDYYPHKNFKEFMVEAASSGSNFNTLFKSYYGYSIDAFESHFLRYMKEKFKYYFLLNFENLAFLFIVFILLGSYFHIRARNRKVMDSWTEEEAEE